MGCVPYPSTIKSPDNIQRRERPKRSIAGGWFGFHRKTILFFFKSFQWSQLTTYYVYSWGLSVLIYYFILYTSSNKLYPTPRCLRINIQSE